MNENIKELAKKIPGLRPAVRFAKERVIDARAISRFLSERRLPRDRGKPIKVGFLCQYIPAWTKIEVLYQKMQEDENFEPYIICVPSGIIDNKLVHPESLENDAYDYCIRHGYKNAINALVGINTWVDLKELHLDYIFYPRPYNAFMPHCYTTAEVSKHCRICMVMYCIEFAEETERITHNRDFMSNVYYYFADFQPTKAYNTKQNYLSHKLGLQKTVCTGYPMIEKLMKFRDTDSPSWSFSQNAFKVLWTPRWTTDPYIGGTNFFEYKDTLLEFADAHSDIDILIRPHPLAFSHFVEVGKMTEDEVREYRDRCDRTCNVSLDKEAAYEATFWESSVLVSDISSIIPEYFVTGKPVIFCCTNMEITLVEHIKQLLNGCYVVHNEEELTQCILMLQSGNDPMAENRKAICADLFSGCDGIYEKMMETILEDASLRKQTNSACAK